MEVKKYKFGDIYKLYADKITRKNRKTEELDNVINWLTGYTKNQILSIDKEIDLETFFNMAPELNPNRKIIKGSVCGVKIEQIEDPIIKEIRYLDKLVDELAKGKSMEKILRR